MKKLLTVLVATSLITLSGCGTINNFVQDNERTARVATTYATLKAIKGDPVRAQRVLTITERVLVYAHDTAYLTVDALVTAIRAEINWDSLDDADTLLYNELLIFLGDSLKEHFEGNAIPPEMVVTLDVVGEWVTNTARMYL